MGDQSQEVTWQGEVPVSTRFDDPYFSFVDGLAETRHVFLKGNGLPGRFCEGFQIAELGFGTGLNALAALQAWRSSGVASRLYFTSFEMFPMERGDMERALAVYPELGDLAAEILAAFDADGARVSLADFELTVVLGDARQMLPAWKGAADAWFLDGFSPAKNPELWEPELLAAVGNHTRQGGTAATYSAAGDVRRGLEAAGFTVERVPGFGRKRHMTVARLT